jgi:hypothetical protein
VEYFHPLISKAATVSEVAAFSFSRRSAVTGAVNIARHTAVSVIEDVRAPLINSLRLHYAPSAGHDDTLASELAHKAPPFGRNGPLVEKVVHASRLATVLPFLFVSGTHAALGLAEQEKNAVAMQ